MANYVRYQEYFKTFLGGWSFADGDKVLTITKVGEEEFRDVESGGTKKGLVLHFKEVELPMVINVTNATTIAEVTGTDVMQEWVGRKIQLGTSPVKAFGQVHQAIRVRNVKPDEELLICEECGGVITAAAGKQPSELVEISKRNTGRVLCLACMKKAKEAT